MSKPLDQMTAKDWMLVLSLADKCARSFWEKNGSPTVDKGELAVVDARHMPRPVDYTRLKGMAKFFELNVDLILSAFNNRFQTHYGCLLLGHD